MKTPLLFLLNLILILPLHSQPDIEWERDRSDVETKVDLFHSIEAINFPTTQTIRAGEFEYEIAHRFQPKINAENAFFGIDGPAYIRMALAYGLSEDALITLGRSSLQDNIDLRLKYKLYDMPHHLFPFALAVRGGAAWNTEVVDRDKTDSKNFQYYGQFIANTLIGDKVGIGVVPSYLYNSHIYCENPEYSFTIGSYVQWYIGRMFSLIAEGNMTVTGFRDRYDSFNVGFELETGGHFFKIFVGNNYALNPSQYLAGADKKFSDYLRLGFNITRILKF